MHPLSCVPWLHGRYPLHGYYGRSDSRRGGSSGLWAMNSACPLRVSLITAMGLLAIPSPTINVSTGGSPGCPTIWLFAYCPFYRLRLSLEDSPIHADRIEFTATTSGVVCVTDWSFSFRCSPPRITATQLRFDAARLFTAQRRTFTALSHRPLRRTSAASLAPRRKKLQISWEIKSTPAHD